MADLEFNWYPGHIAKAERQLKDKLSVVDLVIEIRDARAPYASAHRDLLEWVKAKSIIPVIQKTDLADKNFYQQFIDDFLVDNQYISKPIAVSAKKQRVPNLVKAIDQAAKPIRAKHKSKGILNQPIKVMVCGYPNVGKSTLINKLAQIKKAKTENKAGVTRQQQWIDMSIGKQNSFKLLDTPGIIPPKFYSQDQALKLALTGALGDKAFEHELLVREGVALIESLYPGLLAKHYKLTQIGDDFLTALAEAKHIDLLQAADMILYDFRAARLGNLSLE